MIDTNDILRALRDCDAGLLWHLHSYCCEQDGDQRFEAEMRNWFPEKFEAFKNAFYSGCLTGAIKYVMGAIGCSSSVKPRTVTDLLYAHKARSEKEAREKIYLTNIGRAVWQTLDECLEERRPFFLQGWEGRGKSTAVKAWCAAHRGQARFVSLPGICGQREFFGYIAEAYGIPFKHAQAPNMIRIRVSDVVKRAGLVLVIDEAHRVLPERTYHGRPVLIDWIDSVLCDAGVANTLISTPQFGPSLASFENQEDWNARQFMRRYAGGWRSLDENTTPEELLALAKHALPHAGEKGAKLAAKYAQSFSHDFARFNEGEGVKRQADASGLFDLVHDAEKRARKAGRMEVTFQDVRDAYNLDRLPAENAMAAAFAGPVRTKRSAPAVALQEPAPVREMQPPALSRRMDTLNHQTLEPAQ